MVSPDTGSPVFRTPGFVDSAVLWVAWVVSGILAGTVVGTDTLGAEASDGWAACVLAARFSTIGS